LAKVTYYCLIYSPNIFGEDPLLSLIYFY